MVHTYMFTLICTFAFAAFVVDLGISIVIDDDPLLSATVLMHRALSHTGKPQPTFLIFFWSFFWNLCILTCIFAALAAGQAREDEMARQAHTQSIRVQEPTLECTAFTVHYSIVWVIFSLFNDSDPFLLQFSAEFQPVCFALTSNKSALDSVCPNVSKYHDHCWLRIVQLVWAARCFKKHGDSELGSSFARQAWGKALRHEWRRWRQKVRDESWSQTFWTNCLMFYCIIYNLSFVFTSYLINEFVDWYFHCPYHLTLSSGDWIFVRICFQNSLQAAHLIVQDYCWPCFRLPNSLGNARSGPEPHT